MSHGGDALRNPGLRSREIWLRAGEVMTASDELPRTLLSCVIYE